MKPIKLLAIITIVLAVVVGVLTLFVPLPEGTQTKTGLFTQLGFSAAMFILFTGAATIFVLGLKNFKDKLKVAYGILCSGIVLIALAQLQVPVFTWLNLMETFWVRSGPIVLPFILAVVAVFLGVRAIGRLFGVKSILLSVWFFFFSTIVLSVLISFLPHAPTPTDEISFDASTALPAWTDFGMIIAVGILLLTKRKASVVYANAFAWLIVGLGTTISISLTYVTLAHVLGDKHWFVVDGYIYAVFVAAGMALVRAAYAFYTIPEQAAVTNAQAVNFFGKPHHLQAAKANTSMDIVMYAASLASKREDIDHLLDTVRIITARRDKNDLTDADRATLKDTYLKIEDYLLTREPVRKFDRSALRQDVQEKLNISNATPTFWHELVW